MQDKNIGEKPRETFQGDTEIKTPSTPDVGEPIGEDNTPSDIPAVIDSNAPTLKQSPEHTVEIQIDKRTEISTILQENLREKLEKLPYGAKKDIINTGRELRDRLYAGMGDHSFTDTRIVEVIYEWLSKFDLGNEHTKKEAHIRAELIRELYNN